MLVAPACISFIISAFFFFFNDTATTEIYTLSLHDALPTCVGFLSSATNIVSGDTNEQVDAFVAKIGRKPRRVSRPGGQQSALPTTAVAVSGDCKVVAFVTGGKLYVSKRGGRARRVKHRGNAADPSFSTGRR